MCNIGNLTQKLLNGYYFVKQIDHGGMSQIYLVKNIINQHEFVAKVYNNCNKETDSSYKIEIECLRNLDHPNIIKLFDFFEYNDNLVLILEHCLNKSLQHYIDTNGPLKFQEYIKIMKGILEALI